MSSSLFSRLLFISSLLSEVMFLSPEMRLMRLKPISSRCRRWRSDRPSILLSSLKDSTSTRRFLHGDRFSILRRQCPCRFKYLRARRESVGAQREISCLEGGGRTESA